MKAHSLDYCALLRDLSEHEPRHGFLKASDVPLSDEQAAVVVREFPDVVGEALAGHEMKFSAAMVASVKSPRFDLILAGFAAEVFSLIREKCKGYILSDLMAVCEERAEARRVDRIFEREAV